MVLITVAFNIEEEQWSHVFEVAKGSTILELKEEMLKPEGGTKKDVDSFELRRLGRRAHDADTVLRDQMLDFEYLGPEEGGRLAREDARTEPPEDKPVERARPPPARTVAAHAAKAAAAPVAAPAVPSGPLKIKITIDKALGFHMDVEVPAGSTVLQVKEQLAASDPTGGTRLEDFGLGIPGSAGADGKAVPLPDSTVLSQGHQELETTGPPPAQHAAWDPNAPFTLERARMLQRDLNDGFSAKDFQQNLEVLHKRFPDTKKFQFKKEQQELFLTVQSKVLPKYGFAGDMVGVMTMMKAYAPFTSDPEVMKNSVYSNKLLRIG